MKIISVINYKGGVGKTTITANLAASVAEDMNFPGSKFHQLIGNRKGEYSVTVSGNWRLTFVFEDGDAYDVNYEDYHEDYEYEY